MICNENKMVIRPGASFQNFLGGPKFFKFFNATGLLKNWKKQHFLCRNFTLFIVPFFLSIFTLFFLFSFFLSFFLLFLGRGGATAPSPPQMTPLDQTNMAPHGQKYRSMEHTHAPNFSRDYIYEQSINCRRNYSAIRAFAKNCISTSSRDGKTWGVTFGWMPTCQTHLV